MNPAVISTGTLFKAAFIPGIFLALLYATYALIFAYFKPEQAPPVHLGEPDPYDLPSHYNHNSWLMVGAMFGPLLAMSALWIGLAASGFSGSVTIDEVTTFMPLASGTMPILTLIGFILSFALALRPSYSRTPIYAGFLGMALIFIFDWQFIPGDASGGLKTLYYFVPGVLITFGLKHAIPRLNGRLKPSGWYRRR